MKPVDDSERLVGSQSVMLPHSLAASNLARWLTRNDADAQDVVQDAYLRALRFYDSFAGGNGRGWLLAIVRNTCYSWMRRNRPAEHSSFTASAPLPDRFAGVSVKIQGKPSKIMRVEPTAITLIVRSTEPDR